MEKFSGPIIIITISGVMERIMNTRVTAVKRVLLMGSGR